MAFFDRFTGRRCPSEGGADIEGILDNLNNILNTRQGYGSFMRGYGVRDLNEYSTRDRLAIAVMEEVRFSIETFEPRVELVDISIENAADPFRIAFRIECRVKDSRQSLLMEFNSVNKHLNVSND